MPESDTEQPELAAPDAPQEAVSAPQRPLEGPQGVTGNPDGTVTLRVGSAKWVLRIPEFEEYREACLASDKAIEAVAAPTVDELGLTDPVIHSYLTWAPARYAFWRSIVTTLARNDDPFPPDSKLPLWLASADPINTIMECWLTNPQAAPGGQ